MRTHRRAVEIARFRAEQRATGLRQYEVVASTDRRTAGSTAAADAVVRHGWERQPFPATPLVPPIAWDELGVGNRSWQFHLHSWDALSPVLAAYRDTGGDRYLHFALEVALDWVRSHPTLETQSPFAWYDMAIGMRAYRLGYLLDVVTRDDRFADGVVAELVDAVLLHLEALSDDARFAAHSNHGFYFAAGEAALAKRFPQLPGTGAASARAQARLGELIEQQFSAEGMHREHSPDYHRMVLGTFEGLVSADLVSPRFAARLRSIQSALAWFVLPNQRLAMFGDTPHRDMSGGAWRGRDPALAHVVTGGRRGAPPPERIRAFPETGYVVFREGWSRGTEGFADWGYLAQTCAFHSRVHKHADDLSFVWYDRGCELLVDAGRYGYLGKTEPGSDLWKAGYWYADPARIYVESTAAHNCVQVDGQDLPRAGIRPYGSALRAWGEDSGVAWSVARTSHTTTVHQQRVLLYCPGEWLVVVDRVEDDAAEEHRFTQRFHLAPELEIVGGAEGTAFQLPAGPRLHLTSLVPAEPLEPVRGRSHPQLLGWVSRQDGELTPTWTAGFCATGSAQTFATLFSLGSEPPEPMPARVEEGSQTLVWRWDKAVHTVRVGEESDGDGLRVERLVSRIAG